MELTAEYRISTSPESWLDSLTISSYVFGAGYEVFRCDRNKTNSRKTSGGGVLVAVDSRLQTKMVEDDSWKTVEQVWIAIQLDNRQPFLCAVYISPDRTRDLHLINTHCRSVSSTSVVATPCDEVEILGDFNFTSITWIPIHNGVIRLDLGNLTRIIALWTSAS